MRQLTDQEIVRREKAENIRNLGMDPFGQKFDRTDYAQDIKDKYKDVEHDAFESMGDTACVAGRIMFIRKMGKASFFSIQDKTGKIQVYMPNSLDDGLYKYADEYLVNSTLTYTGASADNKKTLEIGNQGGCICISFANMGLGNYKSNDDQEIEQGASILQKMNIANEDLKFKVSFDLVIEVDDKSYKTNMVMDLPIDELVGQKETHKEITDFKDVIFKRL